MSVNLSIKNAPDDIVTTLKARAVRNHRSLQGELMAILEQAAEESTVMRFDEIERLAAKVRAIGLPSPSLAVQMIREDRDADDR